MRCMKCGHPIAWEDFHNTEIKETRQSAIEPKVIFDGWVWEWTCGKCGNRGEVVVQGDLAWKD